MLIAVDSSLLVGLLVPNDLWHAPAVELLDALAAAGHSFLYLDCVVAESISVATRRLHEKGLGDQVRNLVDQMHDHVPAASITWILPDVPRLYPEILDMVRSSAGALNFNDALIALACREREIPAIASFDADFDGISWLDRLARPEDVLA